MAINLILSDLDGTLLRSDKSISPATYAALERAAAQGVTFVPSTGRFFAAIPPAARELPFARYYVCANGAQVYDAWEDRVLLRHEIGLEEARPVFDELDKLPVIWDCFADGGAYMDKGFYKRIDEYISDPVVNRMVKEIRQPVEDLRAFLAQRGRSVQKIQMFFADMDRRRVELRRLAERFPEMAVASSIANNIELNAKKANKGEALRFLCRRLGLSVEQSMAFGDSSNDLSMIQAAGVGVAMGNADGELLAAADYVTDSNDNDGVAKAVEKFCF